LVNRKEIGRITLTQDQVDSYIKKDIDFVMGYEAKPENSIPMFLDLVDVPGKKKGEKE